MAFFGNEKKKAGSALIIGIGAHKPEKEDTPNGDHEEMLTVTSEEAIEAIHNNDPESLRTALKDFFTICSMAEEDGEEDNPGPGY